MLYDTIGSVIVIVGAVIMNFTNWYFLDPLASFVLAALIVKGAIDISSEKDNDFIH